jgi:hypothetical protein
MSISENFIPPNGWKLGSHAENIIKAVKRNNGECPCVNDSTDKKCPCSNFRFKHICCCGLYVKSDTQ